MNFTELAKRHIESKYARYNEYVLEMAAEGYSPHYCIHGTDLWTDYDNICGGCEAGATMEEEIAGLAEAAQHSFETTSRALAKIAMSLYDMNISTTDAQRAMKIITDSAIENDPYAYLLTYKD